MNKVNVRISKADVEHQSNNIELKDIHHKIQCETGQCAVNHPLFVDNRTLNSNAMKHNLNNNQNDHQSNGNILKFFPGFNNLLVSGRFSGPYNDLDPGYHEGSKKNLQHNHDQIANNDCSTSITAAATATTVIIKSGRE
jgi:hypothetical protein